MLTFILSAAFGQERTVTICADNMRPIHPREFPLVEFLFKASGRTENPADLLVNSMDDGGMGSLKFASGAVAPLFGMTIAACEFEDIDGVLVSVVLNVDEEGALFEVDVWKVDFAPLRRWPLAKDLRASRI